MAEEARWPRRSPRSRRRSRRPRSRRSPRPRSMSPRRGGRRRGRRGRADAEEPAAEARPPRGRRPRLRRTRGRRGAPPCLGLTGGIGSGKSEALAAFARVRRGDAVERPGRARRSTATPTCVARRRSSASAPGSSPPAGAVDRAALGAAGVRRGGRARLPRGRSSTRVERRRRAWIAEQAARRPPPPLLVCEVPLLFEAGARGPVRRRPGRDGVRRRAPRGGSRRAARTSTRAAPASSRRTRRRRAPTGSSSTTAGSTTCAPGSPTASRSTLVAPAMRRSATTDRPPRGPEGDAARAPARPGRAAAAAARPGWPACSWSSRRSASAWYQVHQHDAGLVRAPLVPARARGGRPPGGARATASTRPSWRP